MKNSAFMFVKMWHWLYDMEFVFFPLVSMSLTVHCFLVVLKSVFIWSQSICQISSSPQTRGTILQGLSFNCSLYIPAQVLLWNNCMQNNMYNICMYVLKHTNEMNMESLLLSSSFGLELYCCFYLCVVFSCSVLCFSARTPSLPGMPPSVPSCTQTFTLQNSGQVLSPAWSMWPIVSLALSSNGPRGYISNWTFQYMLPPLCFVCQLDGSALWVRTLLSPVMSLPCTS